MENPETKWQQTRGVVIALIAGAAMLPILGLWKALEAVGGAFRELGRDFKKILKGEG